MKTVTGFTYLKDHGRFPISPHEYAAAVRRYRDRIGRLDFAAPQDWMCEPEVITGGWRGRLYFVGTGLSVAEHQRRTVASYLELRRLAPDLPWIPVLQGWTLAEYATCADLYADAGVDLAALPVVGLGSVCRRQSTTEMRDIVTVFAGRGLKLHTFGVKTLGLGLYGHQITSADSMAWSQAAKHEPAWPGHTHKNCANCLPWATNWRTRLLDRVQAGLAERAAHGEQGELFDTLDCAVNTPRAARADPDRRRTRPTEVHRHPPARPHLRPGPRRGDLMGTSGTPSRPGL